MSDQLDNLAYKIKTMHENMQDAFLHIVRSVFGQANLSLSRDKLAALEVVTIPPVIVKNANDVDNTAYEEYQQCLDQEYRNCLDIAMPIIRYLIPEIYTLKRQKAIVEYVKNNVEWIYEEKRKGNIKLEGIVPIETHVGVITYKVDTLAGMLDNPFGILNDDDLRMLILFRIVLNL